MRQKDFVNAYLITNFERIQSLRKLQGFSWKLIVTEIVALHPDIGLDPENEGHRDRVRNNFINIRKRSSTSSEGQTWQELTMDKLEKQGREEFRKQVASAPGYVKVEGPVSEKVSTAMKDLNIQVKDFYPPKKDIEDWTKAPEFKYTDTYNASTGPILTESDEFKAWKKEKDRVKNQQGMHIVLGCVHLPAVNQQFFKAFEEFLGDAKDVLKGIHLIGDILDCKALSSHDNGQVSEGTLEEEYIEANKYLDRIDALLSPGVEKNYLWGNHEERYARIIKKVDISKFGGALLSPTKGCKFAERGYTIQEDYKNAKIQLGKYLDLIHGDYITQNPSKKHLDVYKKSIMFAHTHKMGAYYDGDKAAFNIGWMGNSEHSAFNYCGRLTKSQWQNGFAVVNIDQDGFYHVQLVQWYNGRFIFGTREYKG